MCLRQLPFAITLGPVLLCPVVVHADPISFGYNFTTPSTVTGDFGNLGDVSFSTTAGGQASGIASVVAANLTAVTSATSANPDTFSGESYSLTMQLTDSPSGQSGSLTFNGRLFGSLSATASNITTSFSPGTQQLQLGNDVYTVSIGPLIPPPGSNPTVVGTLMANISVAELTETNPVSESPEPAGLVLAVLAVTGVAAGRNLRRPEVAGN